MVGEKVFCVSHFLPVASRNREHATVLSAVYRHRHRLVVVVVRPGAKYWHQRQLECPLASPIGRLESVS